MIMSPLVSAVCVDRRASALNRLHAFYCIGAVGTVMVASAGLRLGVPWRWIAAGIAFVPAILMVGFLRVRLPPLVHPDQERQGLRFLMRYPRFYAAMAAIALVGATEAGMAQWLPAYSEQTLGYSKATGGMMLAAFSVAMGIGRLAASCGHRRINPYLLVGTAGLTSAGLYVTGASAANAPLALAACVLVGLSCSVLWPTSLGITADHIPHGGATLFALMAAAGNVGCLVAPWTEGLIAEHWGLRVAFLAAASCPLLLVAVVWLTWLADRSPLPITR
jgi:fucose permease